MWKKRERGEEEKEREKRREKINEPKMAKKTQIVKEKEEN